ncbi:winged helix-turn-helix domain-containing protein [Actinopolymorpha sp. B17G11]|uniref:winged helix-turn-helix domain-containing protein n=1 Tax=Actinopolymorpha sp. B17G11 TaxID=3160861 RepID=UPI0032E3B52E
MSDESDQSDESVRAVQPEATRDLPPRLAPRSEVPLTPRSEVPLNARSLRGLAHPVRVRMLGLLREAGPATATTLAHQLGLNTGATSYHLRQLAAHGFVVEDAERGTARERWWRPAHRHTRHAPPAADDDRALGDAYLRAVGLQYAERIQDALDDLPTRPERWRPNLSDFRLRVTPDELDELLTQVTELIGRYRHDDAAGGDSAPADAEPVVVQLQAFLRPGAPTDDDLGAGNTAGPDQDSDA